MLYTFTENMTRYYSGIMLMSAEIESHDIHGAVGYACIIMMIVRLSLLDKVFSSKV